MSRKSLFVFCLKGAVLAGSIVSLLLPLAAKIHHHRRLYEPRTALFSHSNLDDYSYAMIGDSAFASCYVSDDKHTIWKQFEKMTGVRCFPGALNGAETVDILNAARLVSKKLPTRATVFVDIVPTRFMMNTRHDRGRYESQFADAWRKERATYWQYLTYLNLDYVLHGSRIIQGKQTDRNSSGYDRTWNVDGLVSQQKYREFAKRFLNSPDHRLSQVASEELDYFVKAMTEIFRQTKQRVVFVLMPINKTLIFTYSDSSEANRIFSKLQAVNTEMQNVCDAYGASHIDLFAALPENCFADHGHANARGDAMIARALADYVTTPGEQPARNSLKQE